MAIEPEKVPPTLLLPTLIDAHPCARVFLLFPTVPCAVPHLAQAWVAQSSGDGLPNEIGKESYIYEDCKVTSDECKQAHIFDYGADNCIKYEINAGFKSNTTGTFLVKCDAVDCCWEGEHYGDRPDVKRVRRPCHACACAPPCTPHT